MKSVNLCSFGSIVRISSWLDILEFAHFEHTIFICHLERLLEFSLADMIVSHSWCSGVTSSVGQAQWLCCFPKNFVFYTYLLFSIVAVIVWNDITNWGSWPIWSSVWMLFFRQVNWMFPQGVLQPWHKVAHCPSVCWLGSRSCKLVL